jgi:hypothetical protein
LENSQQRRCAICLQLKPLVVDHCHTTNVVRGLLCHQCNVGIGFLNDSCEILENAVKYLKKT